MTPFGEPKSPWPCTECGSVSWLAQAERSLISERDLLASETRCRGLEADARTLRTAKNEAAAEVDRLRETLRRLLGPLKRGNDNYLRSELMFQLGAREAWLWEDDDDGT